MWNRRHWYSLWLWAVICLLRRLRDISHIAHFEHLYTNTVFEGVNSVIQNVKRRTGGFRNMDYFATVIYLTRGKLNLKIVDLAATHHKQRIDFLNMCDGVPVDVLGFDQDSCWCQLRMFDAVHKCVDGGLGDQFHIVFVG